MADIQTKIRKAGGQTKKLLVNESMIDTVRMLSSRGLTQNQMMDYYGVGDMTWAKYCKAYPELRQAILEGKAKTIAEVAGALMKLVRKGNLGAIIFYLKTQGRWRETDKPEEPPAGKPAVPVFTLTVNDPVEAAKIYQRWMMEK